VAEPSSPQRIYNQFAGTSLHRLNSISDGIFAVGMTLLVLGLAVPATLAVRTESDLWHELMNLPPSVVTYFMSFLTLGIFWVGQQTQLSQAERVDRNYTWIHLAFLLAVTLVPFSTALLARFHWSRVALIVYWLNIVIMGAVLLIAAEYGLRRDLFPERLRRTMARIVRRRVYGAQALYFLALLLSVADTHWSIAAIVAIQLNFALGPTIPLLRQV